MDATNPLDDSAYNDRYVAFLDILGFSDLTAQADQHPAWRSWLRECFTSLRSTLPAKLDAIDFRFVQFSDSIVLSAERTPQGLNHILWGVHRLVRNMLTHQILLRGGVAAGNFHHDDNLMFGPALIRAYAFEQRGAPPHIGLDEAVIKDLKLKPTKGNKAWVIEDPWDLSPMLHTLRDFGSYDGGLQSDGSSLQRKGFQFAKLINSHATDMSREAPVRAKWRWMQDYWNRTVAENGILLPSKSYDDWNDQWRRIEESAAADSEPYQETTESAAASSANPAPIPKA